MGQSFPEVVAAIQTLRGTVAIDGELVVMHDDQPDFERLARRALTSLPISVTRARQRDAAVFCAFDLLWRAKDQRKRPLLERKAGLQELLQGAPLGIVYVQDVHAGAEVYDCGERLGRHCRQARRIALRWKAVARLAEDQDAGTSHRPCHD